MDMLNVQNYSQGHVTTATRGGQFMNVTRVQFDVVKDGLTVAHYMKDFMVGRDDTAAITSDMQQYMVDLRARIAAATAL
jgi:hypothetical protein